MMKRIKKNGAKAQRENFNAFVSVSDAPAYFNLAENEHPICVLLDMPKEQYKHMTTWREREWQRLTQMR